MQLDISFPTAADRPKAPPIAGATEAHRRLGRRLGLYHAYHLEQLRHARQALDALLDGNGTAEGLAKALEGLDMIENYRRFGNLCGAECHALTVHHTIEDTQIFPVLRRGSQGLRAVIDQLGAEHVIIHDLIERLLTATAAIAHDPSLENLAVLETLFAALETFVPSHFGYEEAEISEALGYFGVGL